MGESVVSEFVSLDDEMVKESSNNLNDQLEKGKRIAYENK